jgi:6-pyruvoyltetrahydropterin/6-carboxytetrahydropterin synthase
MVYITRKETFSAAHKLERKDWSEEKNHAVFGKCSNENWHGHNYIIYVTVKGEVDPETGFVINLTQVSEIIQKKVLDKVDHKNLNLDVDFMHGILPSTENFAIAIWNQLEASINKLGGTLHCVKVQETEKNFVEYFGTLNLKL